MENKFIRLHKLFNKDELAYFSNNDNVINFINYKLSFNEDSEEFEILTKYIKYFENLV